MRMRWKCYFLLFSTLTKWHSTVYYVSTRIVKSYFYAKIVHYFLILSRQISTLLGRVKIQVLLYWFNFKASKTRKGKSVRRGWKMKSGSQWFLTKEKYCLCSLSFCSTANIVVSVLKNSFGSDLWLWLFQQLCLLWLFCSFLLLTTHNLDFDKHKIILKVTKVMRQILVKAQIMWYI